LRWRIAVLLILFVFAVGHATTAIAQQRPRAAQDEFTPIDQLPPDEKLPAARLLIAAYAVAWVAIALYLWSIWKRLGQVETELADVARRLRQGGHDVRPSTGGSGRR
jgi:CcmD family protein